MRDSFSQEASVSFGASAPASPWRIAEDTRALFEIGFGELWKQVEVEYEASSLSHIRFTGEDLTELQARVEEYGGPMRDISIYANHWANREMRSCDANIWIKGGIASSISFTWRTPLLVDTEAFRYSVERVLSSYRRRKRWSEAALKVSPVRHNANAGSSPTVSEPMLKVGGVKWGFRRWFVQNRDGIIVSLGAGIVVTVGIIALQIFGVIPVPS
ncbi:hypothetical protein NYS50_10550 [Curtobacterium flaccumfaciens pv. flaccumfaciens]|uniref:hypothetical protein n=1 Tax=Curtobacterium flaccumfaciens TaxID=2035 RepID=UPI00217DF9FF|nr:hypothetical protein [Curtobacterium flaccumfaciens]MCS6548320.1 hypothetical protein [Curtobacterium flaccumfaciens pv. flaccumfaciens]